MGKTSLFEISISYDAKKHDYHNVRDDVVFPILHDVIGIGEADIFREMYDFFEITPNLHAFEIDCQSTMNRNGVRDGRIMRFANRKDIDLVKLTQDAYFLR